MEIHFVFGSVNGYIPVTGACEQSFSSEVNRGKSSPSSTQQNGPNIKRNPK